MWLFPKNRDVVKQDDLGVSFNRTSILVCLCVCICQWEEYKEANT